jgi:hypothetical protein
LGKLRTLNIERRTSNVESRNELRAGLVYKALAGWFFFGVRCWALDVRCSRRSALADFGRGGDFKRESGFARDAVTGGGEFRGLNFEMGLRAGLLWAWGGKMGDRLSPRRAGTGCSSHSHGFWIFAQEQTEGANEMRENGPMGRLFGGSWHPAFMVHWPAVSARPPYPACADGEKWGATAGEPYRFTETPALPGRWVDGRVWT